MRAPPPAGTPHLAALKVVGAVVELALSGVAFGPKQRAPHVGVGAGAAHVGGGDHDPVRGGACTLNTRGQGKTAACRLAHMDAPHIDPALGPGGQAISSRSSFLQPAYD